MKDLMKNLNVLLGQLHNCLGTNLIHFREGSSDLLIVRFYHNLVHSK